MIDRAMDIALGEVYTGVFTVRHFLLSARTPLTKR
jgi:hypothetical protein